MIVDGRDVLEEDGGRLAGWFDRWRVKEAREQEDEGVML